MRAGNRIRTSAIVGALLGLASTTVGCGTGRGVNVGTDSDVRSEAPVARTRIQVENRSPLDVEVYAIRFTERFHVGFVVTHAKSSFRLPATLTPPFRDLRILIEPIGSRDRFESERIDASRGEEIHVTVMSTLSQTTVVTQ